VLQQLNHPQKDLQHAGNGMRNVPKEIAQPLGQGQHPLEHQQPWENRFFKLLLPENPAALTAPQCHREIRDYVLCVLQSDGDSDASGPDAGPFLGFRGEGGVGHLDQGVDLAQGYGQGGGESLFLQDIHVTKINLKKISVGEWRKEKRFIHRPPTHWTAYSSLSSFNLLRRRFSAVREIPSNIAAMPWLPPA